MGGKGGTQQTTTNSSPWGPTQPYWQQAFGDIWGTPGTPASRRWVSDSGTSYDTSLPSTTGTWSGWGSGMSPYVPEGAGGGSGHWEDVAATPGTPGLLQNQLNNPNQYITQGWNMTAGTAMDPNNTALLTGSRDYANRVLSGEFLDPKNNLAMAQGLQRGMEQLGAFDSSAEAAGRYGGGAWGQMRGRNLADLQGNLYGQGLQQMTQMSAMAPQIYGSQYLPAQALTSLGQAQEDRPWNLYQRGMQALQGAGGGSTTTISPGSNPWMSGLGGAMAGGAMAGPWGAAAGLGLGYLAGR